MPASSEKSAMMGSRSWWAASSRWPSNLEGRLYLGINDSGVTNNDGQFVATVTLTSPPPS